MRNAPGPVDDILGWLLDLVGRLERAAADCRRAGAVLERCWPDDRGRDWAERLGLVSRQLDRDADACAGVAARLARDPAAQQAPEGAGPAPLGGPRLGSTLGRRVDSARGARIATLSGQEPPPSEGR